MDALLGDEIGRGGFGTVHIHKKDPSLCIKVSNKSSNNSTSCRQWSNEYKKITSFVDNIQDLPSYKGLKLVKVIKPIEFTDTNQQCYMVLPRVFRPEGKASNNLPTIQAQFGFPSVRMVHKGRGEFIGLNEIKEYMSKEDIEIASKELGIIMGLIHFVGKNDAYDVELFLGKEYRGKKSKLFLADFDLSETIKQYDAETIHRMAWSLDAVPYFPRESVDPKLFELFKQGYTRVSPDEKVVEKILEDYE